ncbi:MAG: glycosyl hydrolase family 28-related protein [Verrucomicrobiota bacterium]
MSLDLCARLGLVGGMVSALVLGRVGANEPGTQISRLWGERGELRLEGGRLPVFSYAGYRHGEAEIPNYPVTSSVTDFGARGDDDEDDSEAFLQAIAATEAGAILVPPGRYVITKVLRITRPGVVLRGAGAEQTTLFFPTPLDAIEPNTGATTEGQRTSNYSWSGGFVRLQGWLGSRVITEVTADARRGDRRIEVKDTNGLRVGRVVEIFLNDTAENSLAAHLYSGDPGDMEKLRGKTTASLITRVAAVEPGAVTLERELRFDVRAEWAPVVRAFEPTVRDSGVEDLTFEFPAEPYGGHFSELGYNPVAFVNVAHCWARRLRFVNPDSGPMVGGAFNTVSDVVYESQRAPAAGGVRGHHGIYMGKPGDHLFTRFDIRMRFIHDISVSQTAGVVVSEGRGEDLCFDHHKRAPFEVLFTNIDLGQGTRPWRSGGGAALGKHAGARVTFWNLRAETALPVPPAKFAPWSVNFVGVDFGEPAQTAPEGVWRELEPGVRARPPNLHEAQLARRLKGRGDE